MRSTTVTSGPSAAWGGRMHHNHHPPAEVSSSGSLQCPALHKRPNCIRRQLQKPQPCTAILTRCSAAVPSAPAAPVLTVSWSVWAQPCHCPEWQPAPEKLPWHSCSQGAIAKVLHQTAHSPSAEVPALLPSELSKPTGRILTLMSAVIKAE